MGWWVSLYKLPYVEYTGKAVYTNKVPSCAFRGYGNPQITWVVETMTRRGTGNEQPAAYRLSAAQYDECKAAGKLETGTVVPVEELWGGPCPPQERLSCTLPLAVSSSLTTTTPRPTKPSWTCLWAREVLSRLSCVEAAVPSDVPATREPAPEAAERTASLPA